MALRKALLIAVVVGALLPAATAWPNLHVVPWSVNNPAGYYDIWATQNAPIPVGEALEFIYVPGHNVVMVDQDGYDNCDGTNGVQTWNNGDDIVQLNNPGEYFFICGIGDNCAQGMKLRITAQ